MAMDAEEQKQFDEMKAAKEAADKKVAELEAAAKGKGGKGDKGEDGDGTESALEAARKLKEESETKAAKEKRLVEGAKFIATFDTLIKDAGEFFPKEALNAVEVVNKRKYEDEMERADDLRATIAESVFSEQEKVDLLTEIGKQKVTAFMKMSQPAKIQNAQSIWEYVLNALDTYKRAEVSNKAAAARSGMGTQTDAVKKYEEKLFGLRNKKSEEKK